MSADKLKSLSERINRLLDERDGINGDISDLYQEAKSAGYIAKVLRKAIGRQRMDAGKRAEEDSILELYEAALDGKTKAVIEALQAGESFSATSEKTGTARRTVARLAKAVPKRDRNGTAAKVDVISSPEVATLPMADQERPLQGAAGSAPPGDPGTFERGQGSPVGTIQDAAPQGVGISPDASDEPPAPQPAPDGGVGAGTHESCGGVESRHAIDAAGIADGSRAPSTRPVNDSAAGVAPGPQDPSIAGDDLAFPDFLRREREMA